jgi:23S rRNA (adenine-N6)-dimethyltransferase
VAAQRRGPGPSGRASDGQHFLRSDRLAAELVDAAGIGPEDLVVEIGGGTGRLTAPLAARAGHVLVVERDLALVALLRDRFARTTNVDVVAANALQVPLPHEQFRVFGNLPFAFGTRILRRLLDDPASHVQRLDALLQFEVARKRAQLVPGTLTSIGWQPWWDFRLVRRVHRTAFEPAPSVNAGLLSVTRRDQPLLPASARGPFVDVLSRGFAAPTTPVAVTFRRRVTPNAWKRLAADQGLPREARPADLDVNDWVALFQTSLTSSFGRNEASQPNRP